MNINISKPDKFQMCSFPKTKLVLRMKHNVIMLTYYATCSLALVYDLNRLDEFYTMCISIQFYYILYKNQILLFLFIPKHLRQVFL